MKKGSRRRRRIAGSLAMVLLLAQLAWAGHLQLHAPDTSDSCRVCVHLERLDAAVAPQLAHIQNLTADESQLTALAESSIAAAVERPRVRAPPFG